MSDVTVSEVPAQAGHLAAVAAGPWQLARRRLLRNRVALAPDLGAELRHPLGIAMVGGLIFSQLLTIFTTPVIYLYFDRAARRTRQWRARRRGEPVAGDERKPRSLQP